MGGLKNDDLNAIQKRMQFKVIKNQQTNFLKSFSDYYLRPQSLSFKYDQNQRGYITYREVTCRLWFNRLNIVFTGWPQHQYALCSGCPVQFLWILQAHSIHCDLRHIGGNSSFRNCIDGDRRRLIVRDLYILYSNH